jgi:hypothetical protein
MVTDFHAKYGLHEVPVALAHKFWKYKEFSAVADQCVAALKSYGLIRVSGKGTGRKVILTPESDRIVRRAPDRAELLKNAAGAPAIHREILQHYREKGLPADDILRTYLVWERPEGQRFNQDVVDTFIKRFRDTLAFANLTASDKIAVSGNDDEEDNGGDDGDSLPEPKLPPKARRTLPVGSKEDVFSLDEGAVVIQWPERIVGASAADIDGWLKLVGSKIKRAVDAGEREPEEPEDE